MNVIHHEKRKIPARQISKGFLCNTLPLCTFKKFDLCKTSFYSPRDNSGHKTEAFFHKVPDQDRRSSKQYQQNSLAHPESTEWPAETHKILMIRRKVKNNVKSKTLLQIQTFAVDLEQRDCILSNFLRFTLHN